MKKKGNTQYFVDFSITYKDKVDVIDGTIGGGTTGGGTTILTEERVIQLITSSLKAFKNELVVEIGNVVKDEVQKQLKPVNDRLDKIESRLESIENCPTVKKELGK